MDNPCNTCLIVGVKAKRRVLVLLGWHDLRVLGTLVRHARAEGWQLETRHFFDETLPHGWHGDGMILSNPVRPSLLRFMFEQVPRQPTVLLDRDNAGMQVAAHVHEDNLAAGRLAAEHLLAMGHQHFAWWTCFPGPVPAERFAGFREALAREGCVCEPLEYQSGGKADEWLRRRQWLGERLAKLPHPLALFAMDDPLAAEAVEVCLEHGLDVPREVAVVGVGNIALASDTSPVPLTSVDIAAEDIALAGARLLDHLMDGGTAPDEPVIIAPRGMVLRLSSAALAVTHPLLLRVLERLRADLAKPFDIRGLAAANGVSARTLYHLFRSELRCTPVEFLQREQLAKAKGMLESGPAVIKELVQACGFGTARTMNRLFLRHEGCSPKLWRKQSRESR
ncbi:MAG: substrate-binding domain-containing protein [Verrucomicrobia bacterium]|nr:substrate-binding domain-containing protein [Verrucomicrobiota bacterium]